MYIEKRVKLGNNVYYIRVDLKYEKTVNDFPSLCIKDYKDSYWDGGDFSILLGKIEKIFTREKADYYDKNISYMADVMYLYNRVPFLSGIKDVYISNNDKIPYAMGYISKEEIEKYIRDNNVNIIANDNFKLWDERTWYL